MIIEGAVGINTWLIYEVMFQRLISLKKLRVLETFDFLQTK
jgi:hypothetical protein